MASPPTEEKWPEYHPGQRKDMMALGVIALNYGQLENMYRVIFSYVTGMNEFQTAAVFNRLPNNQRKDVLYDLMAKTTLPELVKELVRHFALGFGTCAVNRHDIMHSSSGGRHRSESKGTAGIVLKKYTKAGNKEECYATVELLRFVADEIHAYTVFGSKVAGKVSEFRSALEYKEADDFLRRPLPDKPPLPTPLSWHSPVETKEPEPPPESLQE